MKEAFHEKTKLGPARMARLETINAILEEYKADGYTLTLRQLYYQLVSRDIIPNNDKEYKKIGEILVAGRMSGVVDWAAIEDRVRKPQLPYSADDIGDAINDIRYSYRLDRQQGQDVHVEIWIEKDALSGIFERVTREFHINLMVNRGYSSCSAMYDAYRRFERRINNGQTVHVLYFGDHDPSGLDMIRDVRDRVGEMLSKNVWGDTDMSEAFTVEQIALNMAQIKQYKPPHNPAKLSDSRAAWYVKKYGNKSWELDALPPQALAKLATDRVEQLIDLDTFREMKKREVADKKIMTKMIDVEIWNHKDLDIDNDDDDETTNEHE